ncbi:hypothetical protein E2562_014259 [Oryza meyeriana var. granulata]|uniref:Uncharacterized protein n=1 Tax=Oryza meyeriana var. granulata TaxID=110450 RepID=A0A6G1BK71_9ORYZ|nr:hypothetical protein E2562_014259 [Oryza meyeriana var. granulata]
MGQKKAKKAAQDKKGKAKVSDSDIEELNTFGKLQSEEHANRLKVLEIQQKLSSEKLEQAKLAHLAAKEQKEAAKEQKEARMNDGTCIAISPCCLRKVRPLMRVWVLQDMMMLLA